MKKLLLTLLLLLPILALAQPPTTNYPTLKYDPTSGAFVPATTNGHTIGPASGIIVGTPAAGDVSVFNSATTIRTGTTSEVMKFTDDGTTFLAGWDGVAGVFKRFLLDTPFQVSAAGSDKLISIDLSSKLDVDGGQAFDDAGTPKLSADFGTRQLYSPDGSSVIWDWSTAGSVHSRGASFSDIEISPGDEGINVYNQAGDALFQAGDEGSGGDVFLAGILRAGIGPTVLTDTNGKILSAALNTVAIANGGTGQATASAAFDALAPSQTSNSGKYLTTNGTTTSWGTVSSGLTIGTTAITGGSGSTQVLIDNSGTLAETSTPTLTGTNFTGIPESGVTSLTSDLALKAPLASPTFTGTVTLPSGQALIAPALGTIASGVGTALTALNGSNISSGTVASARLGNVPLGSIGFTTDGAGATITTGVKGYFIAPATCTITGWSISADGASPTCTIDVWKVATGTTLPTVSNTIMGTKPALATGNAIRSTTMTAWTTATITAGDIIGFNVDAVTVATKLTFQLETTK